MSQRPITGIIFDLDGTLVDSQLDFSQIRQEIGLPDGQPILEAIEHMSQEEATRCHEILDRHEIAGAERAQLIPGVTEMLATLAERELSLGLITRNSRQATDLTLQRLNIQFDHVLAREDAPAKPDPTAIHMLCRAWDLSVEQTVIIGDFHFDLEAGKRAGAWTVLYTRGRNLDALGFEADAHHVIHDFRELAPLLAWLNAPS